MADLESLRTSVRQSLPEIADIREPSLRDKVVEAWTVALAETEYERIEDLHGTGGPRSGAR